MRILIITQYFYPENFRINDLALELHRREHEVTILTGLPNYPKGEYYPGYDNKTSYDETWQGIRVYRCKLRPRKQGAKNLVLNYLSFVYQASKKMKELYNQTFDVIYVFEVSPITVALPAIRFKRKKHVPIIINIQDLWPENIIAVTGIKNDFIIRLVNIMVNYIYKHCDYILCASPSFVNKIQERVEQIDKVRYWPQYSTVSKTDLETHLYDSSKFNIVFTGNIGEAQGIDIAIEAANKLRNRNICWHFVGDGRNKQQLEDLAEKYQLHDIVKFHGFHPETEIPLYLASADAALLILKNNPVFEMTIPAKLQTYLSCGVPIIGCVSGEGKRIIRESKAGIVSDEVSSDALVETCLKFLQLNNDELADYKNRALEYGDREFNKQHLIDKLEAVMEKVK